METKTSTQDRSGPLIVGVHFFALAVMLAGSIALLVVACSGKTLVQGLELCAIWLVVVGAPVVSLTLTKRRSDASKLG